MLKQKCHLYLEVAVISVFELTILHLVGFIFYFVIEINFEHGI